VANGINATNSTSRLSEIFGKVALKNDTFFFCRSWYLKRPSEQAIADLDKNSESYKLTMGYLDGINQYMKRGYAHRVPCL
jgi:penicillin amidase